jgi:hypothetical protein
LVAEGWIDPHPKWGKGWWIATRQGLRLRATPLIKRFPVSEGRALLPAIIEEARRLNANPEASTRITNISLVGSVLHGGETDDAGDIDLIVHTALRTHLPENELQAYQELELASLKGSASIFARVFWGETILMRQLKKVSRKISLVRRTKMFEALPDTRQQSIYAYDVEQERELPSASREGLSQNDADAVRMR